MAHITALPALGGGLGRVHLSRSLTHKGKIRTVSQVEKIQFWKYLTFVDSFHILDCTQLWVINESLLPFI